MAVVHRLTLWRSQPYFADMEQLFMCAYCGEENDIYIDPQEGDKVDLIQDCRVCCRANLVTARFNYYAREYDLTVSAEAAG